MRLEEIDPRWHKCPDCGNHFAQPFRCTTCGAQKLYDTTVTNQAAEIARLKTRVAELEQVKMAAETLAEKIEMVDRDPQCRAVWVCSQIHNGPYEGPNYGSELRILNGALSRANGTEG